MKTLFLTLKVITKSLGKVKKISRPNGVPGEIMKLSREAMTPCLARLLEISLNNANVPKDSKIATVFHIYKGGFRSALSNYRPISLTSVACKQLEHVIAGYLRQVWDKNDWFYEG